MPRPDVIVTQSGNRGAVLAAALRDCGFRAEHMPLIETVPLAEAVSQLAEVTARDDAWVFTSAAAVRALASCAPAVARLQEAPAAFALGSATWRDLRAVAPNAVHFPGVRGAKEFAERLLEVCPPSRGFIFPRGRLALEVLPEELRRVGRRVTEWIVYDTVLRPEAADQLAERSGDIVVLFSPSAVSAIAAHPVRDLIFAPGRFAWLPFGGTTASALDRLGVRHLEPPPEPSHEALIHHLETLYPKGA
ncbi:uroporphyrinogen-III synthase [Alicyclobacillus acidocaldarius]|uniref:Uroporphyrinogen-III synthase n=1 Tax=Alicyclobacillus acidocaldarius (strain Tc-4-1) TaxID=1048834 RepID=F8IDJ6_ALIAT|nr:uroporphyrinogen-III synthase [Alicyclobacillus acidocaldarius]AEJ43849.1 Uroporphyrinogen III synthase HEM4 [Alicyclobacillus acidocaldarius subsp. acidocaldarius Tc-4-1]